MKSISTRSRLGAVALTAVLLGVSMPAASAKTKDTTAKFANCSGALPPEWSQPGVTVYTQKKANQDLGVNTLIDLSEKGSGKADTYWRWVKWDLTQYGLATKVSQKNGSTYSGIITIGKDFRANSKVRLQWKSEKVGIFTSSDVCGETIKFRVHYEYSWTGKK